MATTYTITKNGGEMEPANFNENIYKISLNSGEKRQVVFDSIAFYGSSGKVEIKENFNQIFRLLNSGVFENDGGICFVNGKDELYVPFHNLRRIDQYKK